MRIYLTHVLRYDEIFSNVHFIGRLNVCTKIQVNRCKIDDLEKHICLQPTRGFYHIRFKSYGSTAVLMFLATYSFDLLYQLNI